MEASDYPAQSELMDELAAFTLGSLPEDLRPNLIAAAKTRLIDALGCAVFGAHLEHSEALVRAIGTSGGSGATLIGHPGTVPPAIAALINGAFVSSFELDDAGAYVHPGAAIVPAALAVAEAHDVTDVGETLLEGIIVGYEIAVRVAEAAGFAPEGIVGWHTPGFHPAIGAAAACARILGLDQHRTVHAIAMAADMAGGGLMHARFGSDVKRSHTGRAAQTGLTAALMAREGLVGVADVLEHPRWGYLRAISYTGEVDPSPVDVASITADLGTRFVGFGRIAFKYYPVTAKGHGVVDNIRDIRREHGLRPEDVQSVSVGMTRMGAGQRPNTLPAHELRQVNFSYPYAAAIALAYDAAPLTESGAVLKHWQEGLNSDVVNRLQHAVEIVVDDEIEARNPYSMDSRVVINTTGGQVSATVAYGEDAPSPHAIAFRPMSDEDVRAKFKSEVGAAVPDRVEELSTVLEEFERVGRATELTGALR